MSQILIVEDEEITRNSLQRMLQRNGYQVDTAVSIKTARENYTISSFSLIISDMRLPGDSGTDWLGNSDSVPVLIMTSYASLRSAVDSMRRGAADYISKPFDHDEMLAAVKRIIGEQNKQHAPEQMMAKPGCAPHKDSQLNIDHPTDLSLEEYFTHFEITNQQQMSETELAQKLGISRKSLWERRQKLNIQRDKGKTSVSKGNKSG